MVAMTVTGASQLPPREPMPRGVTPMLAKLTPSLPPNDGWGFEIKWDGIRCVAYIESGHLRLESRNRREITAGYPELEALPASLGGLDAVLDAEIVAFGPDGRPSFERLQRRLGLTGAPVVRRRAQDIPAVLVLFDVLYLDGHSTLQMPYTARRALLERLELRGEAWQTPAWHEDGEALFAATRVNGLEGVMAKRLASPYEPGKRSGAWLKVKHHLQQPFVVCGWNQRENATGEAIGAVILGYYTEPAPGAGRELRYAGRVGTGWTEASAADLLRSLSRHRRDSSPFTSGPRIEATQFVEPIVVVDVEFFEWTEDGVLRHPSYKGIRTDLSPEHATRDGE